jgi:hypothetical protein
LKILKPLFLDTLKPTNPVTITLKPTNPETMIPRNLKTLIPRTSPISASKPLKLANEILKT